MRLLVIASHSNDFNIRKPSWKGVVQVSQLGDKADTLRVRGFADQPSPNGYRAPGRLKETSARPDPYWPVPIRCFGGPASGSIRQSASLTPDCAAVFASKNYAVFRRCGRTHEATGVSHATRRAGIAANIAKLPELLKTGG